MRNKLLNKQKILQNKFILINMSKKIQKLKEFNSTIKLVLDKLEFQLFINCIDDSIKSNDKIVVNKQKQ